MCTFAHGDVASYKSKPTLIATFGIPDHEGTAPYTDKRRRDFFKKVSHKLMRRKKKENKKKKKEMKKEKKKNEGRTYRDKG